MPTSLREQLSASLKAVSGERYVVLGDDVYLCGVGGPVRLSEESREQLLSIFIREGAAREFNALHEAHVKAGGIAFR